MKIQENKGKVFKIKYHIPNHQYVSGIFWKLGHVSIRLFSLWPITSVSLLVSILLKK